MSVSQVLARRLLAAAEEAEAGLVDPYTAEVYAAQAAKWDAKRARDAARDDAARAKAERCARGGFGGGGCARGSLPGAGEGVCVRARAVGLRGDAWGGLSGARAACTPRCREAAARALAAEAEAAAEAAAHARAAALAATAASEADVPRRDAAAPPAVAGAAAVAPAKRGGKAKA